MPDSADVPSDTQLDNDEETWASIGREAAIEQLKSTRKTLASDAFQKSVVSVVNDTVDIPVVPEAIEQTAFDNLYDLVQRVSVAAIDRLIASLEA